MNTYILTFKVPYGLYTSVVVASNEDKAIELGLKSLMQDAHTLYDEEDVTTDIIKLPLTPNNTKEEVLYINGWEE